MKTPQFVNNWRKGASGHAHTHWSFGAKSYSTPLKARSSEFQYWFSAALTPGSGGSFREEVRAACRRIDRLRRGRTVALCFSGGLDSELIALTLHELKIPFRAYFLDLWGMNTEVFSRFGTEALARIGQTAHSVRLEKAYWLETHSRKIFSEFGIEYPTYVALTYLFEKIPRDEFIVVGDGDLNRSGPLFDLIGRENPRAPGEGGIVLPIATSAVFYYLWAARNRREGEFYFFSSTPGLIESMARAPLFHYNYPNASTREVVLQSFPELAPRSRTTNWEGDAFFEQKRTRRWLRRYAASDPKFSFWRESSGTVVDLTGIYRTH